MTPAEINEMAEAFTDAAQFIEALTAEGDALRAEVGRLREAARWRPVTDDADVMPGQTLLVSDGKAVDAGYWSGADWTSYDETEGGEVMAVSHWMPLPEPPQVTP